MNNSGVSIAIVGGGVIGLSVAADLIRDTGAFESATIDLFSPQPIEQTTSATAAAFWAPYWVGSYPRHWAVESLSLLGEMADQGVTGVHWTDFEEWLTLDGVAELERELASHDSDAAYWWRDLPGIDFRIEPFRPTVTRTVPPLGDVEFSHRARFRTVVARMSDYMAFLSERAHASGRVRLRTDWVDELGQLAPRYDVVFNCTGWGARVLCDDDPETRQMKLLAGMVCRVENDAVAHATLLHRAPFHETPLYVVPRHGTASDVICGGTAIEVSPPPDPRMPVSAPAPAMWDAIMQRCHGVEPLLNDSDLREQLCGLRPVRDHVRVEVDRAHDNLIHCYGHGGSGLTLSWGSVGAAIKLAHQQHDVRYRR